MADHPLEIPERFQAFARENDADVRIDHFWGAEIEGEWCPESWHITLYREKKIGDLFYVQCLDVPDSIEENVYAWPMQIDLLGLGWKALLDKHGVAT